MEDYLGTIKLFAGDFPPRNYMFCNGDILPIAQYSALFSLIGVQFGGNGTTNFALPDLRGRFALGAGQGNGLSPRPQGLKDGVETVILTQEQMPMHYHVANGLSGGLEVNTPTNAFLPEYPNTARRFYASPISGEETVAMNPQMIGAEGGGASHDNMSPYLTLNYVICFAGVFPSRPVD
ncbi:phage tail protein [Emticicia sp. 17c]|uniref:phage tail protein n=1 Tax=Emticicia sp. 17c TaxID=3127704 RepID=UPI00301D0532